MDASRFDGLTAILSEGRTRRGAVAALLGAVALGSTSGGAPAKGGRKRKRKGREQAEEIPATVACYAGTNCEPGHGATNAGCDFSGSDLFVDLDARGAILANSNFTGADASGADFRGAVLNGACFVDADLTDARIDNSTVLDKAIFCNTIMPGGSLDDSGCGRQTTCCPCPDGQCTTGPGDQPDCAGVLTRAGCKVVDSSPEPHWECRPGANLRGADLSGCRLTHAVLNSAQLQDAFLNRAVFNDAQMNSAQLRNATMDSVSAVNTNFTNANLYNASMGDADLRNAIFQGADLRLRDWKGRNGTTCPDGFHIPTATRPTCCNNLNGSTAKYCGRV